MFTAPQDDGSECFALALANRSACMQKLRSYKTAVGDIDLAIASGYPEQKAFKLAERKAECMEQLGRMEAAAEAYKQAGQMLAKSRLPKDKKEVLAEKLRAKAKKCLALGEPTEKASQASIETAEADMNASQLINRDDADAVVRSICSVASPHEMYPSAHRSYEVRYEPHRGRYVVASEDVPMGTTLISEQPATFTLHPHRFGTHCQNCFAPVSAVVPCPDCVWVAFCSAKCREEARGTYHKFECGVNKLLMESGLNIYSFLVIRLLSRVGYDELQAMRPDLETRSETNGFEPSKVYRSDDLRNVFCLVDQEQTIDSEEWLLRFVRIKPHYYVLV